MPISQQFDDSPEGLKRKKLMEAAAIQATNMESKEPEQGIEEVSATEIPGRKSAIGALKEKMPVAGEVADVLLPSDVEDLVPFVKQGKAAVKMAGTAGKALVKELDKGVVEKAVNMLRKREGERAVETFLTSHPEEQKKKIQQLLSKPPIKEGPTLDYSQINAVKQKAASPGVDYSSLKMPEELPQWKQKQLQKKDMR